MRKNSQGTPTLTVGVDLGDRTSRWCGVDGYGEVVEEGRLRTTEAGFRRRFGGTDRSRVVVEVGTHSPWVSRLLRELGHEVWVANPRQLRLIYRNDRKSDRVDAEYLARIGRLDPQLLSPVSHRGRETQADLAILRSRTVLVGARTRLVNHVRGAVKSVGGRLPSCSTASFPRRVRDEIPVELEGAVVPLLGEIARLTRQIRRYDRQVERLCEERYPETAVLRQVAGVGAITALCYILVLEDPRRFPSSRSVGTYLGLVPRQRDSGSSEPQLRISKAGDPLLRGLLVGSAQYILGPFGPDTELKRWGLKLAERGGKAAKKRAAVAVARKLAVLLHSLWLTGEVYEPIRGEETEEVPAAA